MNNLWPESVIEALAYNNIVFVIGSGFSAQSKAKHQTEDLFIANTHPPTWEKMLHEIAQILPEKQQKQAEILIKENSLLLAAEFINYECQKLSKTGDIYKKIKKLVDSPKNKYHFQPNGWHECLADLLPRIILTTNYDKILERRFREGFISLTLDSNNIQDCIQKSEPIIVHIHGSIENNSTIVLSQSDYISNEIKNRENFNVIESLMRTKIFLFLGYSLSDPDILPLLQRTKSWGSENSRFLLTPDDIDSYKKEMFINSYGVGVLTYSASPDHKNGLEALKDLCNEARQIHGDVY
ncbi:SIR2 family protein [Rothia sp. P5764]|uniref:SIR2 family protein n=1 Tax=Rothia sp. P5764 TaxID=3402654 RepID=UPI003ABE1388